MEFVYLEGFPEDLLSIFPKKNGLAPLGTGPFANYDGHR